MNQQSISGIIQLSLFTSENHYLTLKIIRVKGIHTYLSNLFIKLTIIPDNHPLECHTRTVANLHGCINFNEKFTFEINHDDLNKRLCLSIYDNHSNFHGCLSFGIKNTLKKQKIHGWFYFLQAHIGQYRHKQWRNNQQIKQVTKINRDIVDLEEHQFQISRGKDNSFGFTIVGDSPTCIGKVIENSPAELIGLKSGDFIVKINGQNVSRAQQTTVTNLIKHIKHSIILDIHRYPTVAAPLKSNESSFDSSTCNDSLESYPFPILSDRPFVNLAQLGDYIQAKPVKDNHGTPFYERTNSSIRARKGSPINTFV